jgi:hypothetical protein
VALGYLAASSAPNNGKLSQSGTKEPVHTAAPDNGTAPKFDIDISKEINSDFALSKVMMQLGEAAAARTRHFCYADVSVAARRLIWQQAAPRHGSRPCRSNLPTCLPWHNGAGGVGDGLPDQGSARNPCGSTLVTHQENLFTDASDNGTAPNCVFEKDHLRFCCVEGGAVCGDGSDGDADVFVVLLLCEFVWGGAASDLPAGRIKAS